MFFRRKCPVQPLVVEKCWPTKKARLGGFRKKRNVQIMFTDDQTRKNEAIQLPPVVDVAMEADDALDHIVLQSIDFPPVLDNLQTEEATKESIEVPPEHVLEVVLNDIANLAVEMPPKPVQEVLLQNLWGQL